MRVAATILTLSVLAGLPLSGCGEPQPDQISGDHLDVLLHAPAGRIEFTQSLKSCLEERGFTVTSDQMKDMVDHSLGPSAANFEVSTVNDSYDPELVGSGLTLNRIEMLTGQIAAESNIALSPDLDAAYRDSIEIDGREYRGGCQEFASESAQSSEDEQLRLYLRNEYGRMVTERAAVDERWQAMESAWVECMEKLGYSDYHNRGYVNQMIRQRLNEAGESVAKIKKVLPFDIAVTTAATQCSQASLPARAEIRTEYETQFLNRHGAALAELAAAVENAG